MLYSDFPPAQSQRCHAVELAAAVASVVLILSAAAVAYAAHHFSAVDGVMRHAVAAVPIIPVRQWSLYATFTDTAAAYYLIAWPLTPLAATWVIAHFGFPFRDMFEGPWSWRDRLIGFLASVACYGLAWLGLASYHGGDRWRSHVGSSLDTLVSAGWMQFAASGALLGFGVLCSLKIASRGRMP